MQAFAGKQYVVKSGELKVIFEYYLGNARITNVYSVFE